MAAVCGFPGFFPWHPCMVIRSVSIERARRIDWPLFEEFTNRLHFQRNVLRIACRGFPMIDALIPAWIRELRAQEESDERSRRELKMAESLIRSEAPKIFEQFSQPLANQVEACKLLSKVRNVQFEDFRKANPPDNAFKITMIENTPFGNILATVVRLRRDSTLPHIECLREAEDHGRDYKIDFRVNPLGEVVLVAGGGDATPEMAAEYVVKAMIRDVNKPL